MMSTFNSVKETEIHLFSAICVVGDDDTFQEAVNGMLAREDGEKLPLAFIPNGIESDICYSMGINSLDEALDHIIKAEAIPIDTTRVLLDHDLEPTNLEGEEFYMKCRHMLSNSTLIMPANVAASSKSWWGACCSSSTSFSLATWFKGLSCSF